MLMKESQWDTELYMKGIAGRCQVHLPFTKHLLKFWFINWLRTFSKLTLGAYGKCCSTSLCLPQGK